MGIVPGSDGPEGYYLVASGAVRIVTRRVSVWELGTPGKLVIVWNGTCTSTMTAEFPAASVAGVVVTVAVAVNCGASANAAWETFWYGDVVAAAVSEA